MNFSENYKAALDKAVGLAARTGGLVCTEHLLYGLVAQKGCLAQQILLQYGVSESEVLTLFNIGDPVGGVSVSTRAQRAIDLSQVVAQKVQAGQINTEHLLYALAEDKTSVAAGVLTRRWGIDLNVLQTKLAQAMTGQTQTKERHVYDLNDLIDGIFGEFFNPSLQQQSGASRQSAQQPEFYPYGGVRNQDEPPRAKHSESGLSEELAQFGTDLTQKAKDGKLDPVIGRGKEIERIIQILCRRTKTTPCL